MKILHLFALVIPCLLASQTFAQVFNRPVPKTVPAYRFERKDNSYKGHYLTAPFYVGPGSNDTLKYPKSAMILDSAGYLVWYMSIPARNVFDFKFLPDQGRYAFVRYQHAQDIRFQIFNSEFEPEETFTTVQEVDPDPHDFEFGTEQTVFLTGVRDSIMDLSGYTFNGIPGSAKTVVIGFVVQGFDQDHHLIFQWNSNDHIHPTQAYAQYGYLPNNFDYCHGNTIEEDSDGHLLLSFRNLNAVYKIHRQTGAVLWKLGGKDGDFTFVNDPGFSGQHDIRRLPNGNVSIFDNGNMAPQPLKFSRAVEYRLDTLLWTATKVWDYIYNPPFLAFAMGSHQTTSERYHLVNFGFNFRPHPSFVLTDDNKNILSALYFQDSFMSYRSYVFQLPVSHFERPKIECTSGDNSMVLSASSEYDRYEWSTGEKNPQITVTTPGVYQVWVNYGAGMIGSEPFVVENIQEGCLINSLASPDPASDLPVIGYYDLLGRPVDGPLPGGLYLERYIDGTAKVKARLVNPR